MTAVTTTKMLDPLKGDTRPLTEVEQAQLMQAYVEQGEDMPYVERLAVGRAATSGRQNTAWRA